MCIRDRILCVALPFLRFTTLPRLFPLEWERNVSHPSLRRPLLGIHTLNSLSLLRPLLVTFSLLFMYPVSCFCRFRQQLSPSEHAPVCLCRRFQACVQQCCSTTGSPLVYLHNKVLFLKFLRNLTSSARTLLSVLSLSLIHIYWVD